MLNKNKHLENEKETILSGYVRYRPSNGTYYLMINSRRLCTFLSEKDQLSVGILRQGEFFVVRRNEKGNVLNLRSKELITCISGRALLSDEERKILTSKDTKFSFPVKVKLSPEEFGLDKYSLYPDEDAAKLGRALSIGKIVIPNRIMTPKAFPHDLEFLHHNKRVIIEITQVKPGKENYLNFRHQPQGGSVRAHIFDIYRRCVNAALSGEKNIIGFVILHKGWEKHNHVTQLIPELKNINCHILFTNFDQQWEEICRKEIIMRLQ